MSQQQDNGNRNVTLKSVWARAAKTDIPVPPVPGESYRNTAITPLEIETGQQYDKVFDSSKYNQFLYEVSALVQFLEQYGILPYSDMTSYPVNAVCLGQDGSAYQAIRASGPLNGGAQPLSDAVFWKKDSFAGDIDGKIAAHNTSDTAHENRFKEIKDALDELKGKVEELEEGEGGEGGEGGDGIGEAPSDGNYYARRNELWENITSMLGGGGGGPSGITDAPNDGSAYVRQSQGWAGLVGVLTGLGYTPGGGGGGGTGLAAFSAGAFTGPMIIPSLGSGTRYAWFGHFYNSGESGTQEFAAGTTQQVNGHNGSAGYDSGQGIWIAYIPA